MFNVLERIISRPKILYCKEIIEWVEKIVGTV